MLELLSCSVACKAGSNCLRRFGSWSNGGIGDCGTGETGTAEADVGGADVGFSPEAEDVEGVVQECDTDLSPVDSFLSVFCAGTEDVGVGSFDKVDAPLASNGFFGW